MSQPVRLARLASLVVLASLAACNGNGDPNFGKPKPAGTTAPATTKPPAPVPGPSPTPAATPPATTPPSGSSGGTGGIAGVVPGTASFGLQLDPADARSKYSIYVPRGYSGQPTGVVLGFHGVEGSATPDGWFQVLYLFANQERFIIVCPYGDVNDGGSGAWTQPFGRALLDLVRSKYNVDSRSQYCCAVSGGCLPAIWMALASGPATYTTAYGNNTVPAAFQSDFAAVGFSAPAYSPSDTDFATMTAKDAAGLGFKPALFTDFGQSSNDGPRAQQLADWGTAHGYTVEKHERPNEGHAPVQPFTFQKQMFDLFAATKKP